MNRLVVQSGTWIRAGTAGFVTLLVVACGRKGGPPAFPPPEVAVVVVQPNSAARWCPTGASRCAPGWTG